MRIVSLFAGIGGFELGFREAGDNLGVPIETVFASEKNPFPAKVYREHFGGEMLHGDITKIVASDVPDHDILCGGFPCQDVSLAGKRTGLAGERSGLFFELMRIVREKQPRIVLLENVKGLLSSNGGWDFARVLLEMEGAGYECEWQILNTANFGCPQDRRRVFIVGHLTASGGSGFQIFPLGENDKLPDETKPAGKIHEICTCLTSGGNDKWNGTYVTHCLTAGGNSGGLHSDMDVVQDGETYRRLTPVEWERLQGFPDNWTEGVRDTRRYECLGNAVSPPVVRKIAEKILCEVFT